jgi:hypothetical protein
MDDPKQGLPLSDAHSAVVIARVTEEHAMVMQTSRNIETIVRVDAQGVVASDFNRRRPEGGCPG